MTTDHLDTYAVSGATVQLRADGGGVAAPTGRLDLTFTFPKIGRPRMTTGDPSSDIVVLPDAVRATTTGSVADATALVRAALADRLALVATGDPGDIVPLRLGDPMGDGSTVAFPVVGRPAERRLYDVALRVGTVGWQVVAPHAVYSRASWSDFGLAHVSDLHVARRIDRFRPLLRELGLTEAAERLCNMNDQFRGFVAFANAMHDAGHLDLIVATGDLVDYQFETDDDPTGWGNAGFLRDLVLGTAPGPDHPVVEELRVPMFMVAGNHDYRRHPYHLVFDVQAAGIDLTRVRNFSNLALTEREAMALGNALSFPGRDAVPNLGKSDALRMVEIDTQLRPFREALADPEPHVVELGPHRVVLLDSAHDVGMPSGAGDGIWELVKRWWGSGDEDFATLIGGSPNCEGVDDTEYAVALETLEAAPDDALVLVALHAPLVNPWRNETPYFLRETQRPHQASQAQWWVARHTDSTRERLLAEHPEWFAPVGEAEPAYLKRGDSQDLLDHGVSRGRTDDLLRALAGLGTRRPADLVLAGHTHRYNEISIRRTGETLAYFLDFYTRTPRAWYPSKMVRADDIGVRHDGQLDVPATTTYVEVDDAALPGGDPWPMPWDAKHDWVMFVPPYADPLETTGDPASWWQRHRPLQLQTGALGLWENDQVSMSGFRLLSVRSDVVHAVHFLPRERLDAHRWALPFEQAIAADPPRTHRLRPRSRRFGSPGAHSSPSVLVASGDTHSLVYRDDDGLLVELWDAPSGPGAGRLAAAELAGRAVGTPAGFVADGTAVVLYRGDDGHVHSLYWTGTQPAGHDALSASCGAPSAVGDPHGYVLAGTTHVFYRTEGGHIEELWWPGAEAVSHGRITGYCGEPLAAGDPFGYPVLPAAQNIVVYRGVDDHVHSLYWSDGPTGHDDLSGYCGSAPAAGNPVGLHVAPLDVHHVVYRGQDDHVHAIWWQGAAPAAAADLVAAAHAVAAAGDPACWYADATGTMHVVYPDGSGHVHELTWTPLHQTVTWTDLTVAALAPPATTDRPVGYSLPGSAARHVAYRGRDGHVHEISWG